MLKFTLVFVDSNVYSGFMARKPRVEYAGAIYHVMSRGNRQETIFDDDRDCEIFLDTLEEACNRTGWVVHAFVLMGNHYHLLLETPEPNLVAGMKWLQGTYAQRFNSRHKVWGHLFQGRYKALLVDGEGDYFLTVASYIHLNPARARCFDLKEGTLTDYPWSSHVGYVRSSQRPSWLTVDRVLSCLGFEDDVSGRAKYRSYMKRRVAEVLHADDPACADEGWAHIRRGWVLGSDDFRRKMEDAVDDAVQGKRRDSFSGEMVRGHDEREAERLLEYGLNQLGLDKQRLEVLRKGDDRKKVIAWLIRKNTSVFNQWIAKALHMGHPSGVTHYVKQVDGEASGDLENMKEQLLEFKD